MAKSKSAPPKTKKPAAPKSGGGDHDLVRDLALILRETELTEIEVERNGLKIRVSRQTTTYAAPAMAAAPAQANVQPAAQPLPAVAASPAERATNPGAVKSPMVGTAYHAPQPGAAPFVKVGSEVKEGQTLLIIEAMKTMNQIPAPRSGRVVEIVVKDGQPVEYGEVLMIVE
jgi:acetyl-CoA carboxylase biotin carboxyl carrier protein